MDDAGVVVFVEYVVSGVEAEETETVEARERVDMFEEMVEMEATDWRCSWFWEFWSG